MTFEEIAETLPNGFHDAKLRRLQVDFAAYSIAIQLLLLVGEPDTATPEEYRAGTLTMESPLFFFLEPPDPQYPFIFDGSPVNIDGDSVRAGQNASVDSLLSMLAVGAVAYRFFLEEWNSFLYLAAESVELSWDE